MQTSLKDLFTAHPHAVGESYGEHFDVAMSYSGRLFAAACAAFVHALLPFLFVTTASSAIKAMYANMTRRGATAPLSGTTGDGHRIQDYAI
ncbi:MAG: DUF6356 family protein [Hyphomicrobiales bacterium]